MSGSGFVVWFTGLSGSGKSTLAARLAAELARRGVHVETLDGDEVRAHLSKGLGFSREDRDTNVRRIGFVAKLLARSGACAITAAISPHRDARDAQRRAIPRFVEVYCECPVEVLAARDPKGLYRRALAGEIRQFTGVDDPYEPPLAPEVHCRTDVEAPEESLAKILAALDARGYLVAAQGDGIRRGRPRAHGGELVDRVAHGALPAAARAVTLDASSRASLGLIARGALSPLRGFMTERDLRKVVASSRLENGRPWTRAVALTVTPAEAEGLVRGDMVALCAPDGARVGVMELAEACALEGAVRLGGEVHALGTGGALDPHALRAALDREGFARVSAVPVDRAPDAALGWVLSRALESSDAVVVMVEHPAGEDPAGRVAAVRAACAAMPAARVVVRAVPGDWDALTLAVIAQNLGADRVWFERHRDLAAIDALAPGELGVEVVRAPALGWSARAGAVTALHAAADAVPLGPSRAG